MFKLLERAADARARKACSGPASSPCWSRCAELSGCSPIRTMSATCAYLLISIFMAHGPLPGRGATAACCPSARPSSSASPATATACLRHQPGRRVGDDLARAGAWRSACAAMVGGGIARPLHDLGRRRRHLLRHRRPVGHAGAWPSSSARRPGRNGTSATARPQRLQRHRKGMAPLIIPWFLAASHLFFEGAALYYLSGGADPRGRTPRRCASC